MSEPPPEDSGRDQAGRFRPGVSGNPAGRPRGCRDRATRLMEELLESGAEALAKKAMVLALKGDTTALRLCLERLLPPRKDRPITLDLPKIATAADVVAAQEVVIAAMAEGELSPAEARTVGAVLDGQRRALELTEIEERLKVLEARLTAEGKL